MDMAMADWTDPGWLEDAHAWIHARVAELGRSVVEPIEQPHVRPWATVLRVPTDGEPLWFKASIPALAHEAAVVGLLARHRPDCLPELLAVDETRGWILMADGGVRLREVVERDRDLGRWLELLPKYARFQLDLAEQADELVALGAPDRRLATLAEQYRELVEQLTSAPAEERDRLRGLHERVVGMCDRLAGYGIPETIQHDDFHDGQIFLRGGDYLFFDWGDACVSHPFFTMSVTLEGVLSWGLDDVEESEDIRPHRDAYLGPFASFGTRAELIDAHAIALRLGWICRALNVHRFALALESPHRQEHIDGALLRLQLFAAGSNG